MMWCDVMVSVSLWPFTETGVVTPAYVWPPPHGKGHVSQENTVTAEFISCVMCRQLLTFSSDVL